MSQLTLKQTTLEKVSLLPDSGLRVVLAMVNEMLRQNNKTEADKASKDVQRKEEAFQAILAMRENSPFPADFDYDKAREEALAEKYGRVD